MTDAIERVSASQLLELAHLSDHDLTAKLIEAGKAKNINVINAIASIRASRGQARRPSDESRLSLLRDECAKRRAA
jgi:hypothetical protein